eukprot:m.835298 g.835298  ORF g.835298 m.835298 type:complete len:325 (-) comp23454_c0_seq6:319-1293(-)
MAVFCSKLGKSVLQLVKGQFLLRAQNRPSHARNWQVNSGNQQKSLVTCLVNHVVCASMSESSSSGHNEVEVHTVPTREDNYVYILRRVEDNTCAVIDPSDAQPIFSKIREFGEDARIVNILNTHHHHDHVDGNAEIKAGFRECVVVAPALEADKIPCVDDVVHDNNEIEVLSNRVKVISTPGHTNGHVAFYIPAMNVLFCGDTLFSLGCGRLFEGSPEDMLTSLQRISSLPRSTLVHCGHEYTLSNAAFAQTIEKNNAALDARVAEVRDLRRAGKPTVPTTLGLEMDTNPFLRAHLPEVKLGVGMGNASTLDVFTELRARKDVY